MSFANEARGRLTEARNVLIDRRRETNDPKERAAIDDAIRELNENLGFVNQAALLDAATIVVEATKALEAVVRSARLGPFDLHLKALEGTVEKLAGLLRNGEVGEHLERATDPVVTPTPTTPSGASPVSPVRPPTPATPGFTTTTASGNSPLTAAGPTGASTGTASPSATASPSPAPSGNVSPAPTTSATATPAGGVQTPTSGGAGNVTAPASTASPAGGAGPLPPTGTSLSFAAVRAELDAWFRAIVIRDEFKDKAKWHTTQLLKNQSKYRDVGLSLNRMPWAMVGVIHAMECGFNFACHLHNGDPITSRTKHVPAGQPQTGAPPYSWENSAIDALNGAGLNTVTDWSVPHMLYLLEKYNGFGYRKMGKATPYLWSFSNLYEKGKYVADGRFDPEAVSKQCGAGVMLKVLLDQGTDLSA